MLPLLISLKIQLEKKRSILLRDLMLYFKVITVNFKQEMEVVFQDNPRLKREIEYDIRHFDESVTPCFLSLFIECEGSRSDRCEYLGHSRY